MTKVEEIDSVFDALETLAKEWLEARSLIDKRRIEEQIRILEEELFQ